MRLVKVSELKKGDKINNVGNVATILSDIYISDEPVPERMKYLGREVSFTYHDSGDGEIRRVQLYEFEEWELIETEKDWTHQEINLSHFVN